MQKIGTIGIIQKLNCQLLRIGGFKNKHKNKQKQKNKKCFHLLN